MQTSALTDNKKRLKLAAALQHINNTPWSCHEHVLFVKPMLAFVWP